jgi:hypothetical protein
MRRSRAFFECTCHKFLIESDCTANLSIYPSLIANQIPVPSSKFRDLATKNVSPKEQEFKTRNLRVYAIQVKGIGKILVSGGMKNSQVADIRRFRSIKYMFLETL